MDYGLLLDRSIDFDDYLLILKPSYPARVDRVIGLALAQRQWDRPPERSDPVGEGGKVEGRALGALDLGDVGIVDEGPHRAVHRDGGLVVGDL